MTVNCLFGRNIGFRLSHALSNDVARHALSNDVCQLGHVISPNLLSYLLSTIFRY